MSDRWRIARLDELGTIAAVGRPSWFPLRRALGVAPFGVNAWRATEAGQELIGEHDEASGGAGRHEELYVVLDGHATFTVDGNEVDAPAGTLVFVRDPELKRAAVAREAGTTVLVAGARAGEAFTPSPWESSAEALQHFATGEYERARELLEERLREEPENAGVLYNLACAESLTGRTDDALAHLERAIALNDSFRELAAEDSDFDAIRGEPGFPGRAG